MALQRGYGTGVAVSGASSQSGPRNFWLKPGTETTVVLLDEDPIEIVRHILFLKGDKTAAKMRQTCWGMNPREHPEPCPRNCLVCNKALSAPRQIGRRGYLCSSLIDERQFDFQGKTFKDMKLLLELPSDAGDSWQQRKRTLGALRFRRFRVYRSSSPPGKPQTTPRHGDNWQDLGIVDPVQHFWHSPAIRAIMEAAARRGEPIDHQQAVMQLITPVDYDREIGQYKPEEAEAFVAYLEGRTGGGGISVPGGGSYTPPPPPPSSTPSYGTTPGGVAVPPGAMPAHPGPQNPQPPQAPPSPPQHAPQYQPQSYGQQPPGQQAGQHSAPPPPVPDPAAAGGQMAPGGYTPPPPPSPQGTGYPGQPQGQGAPPNYPATPPQNAGAQPAGLPPMPGGGQPQPQSAAGTPQEGVNRIQAPVGPPPGATPPAPGAYAPPGMTAPPSPPPSMGQAPQPAPGPAGPGYAPPSGPPPSGPVPQPQPQSHDQAQQTQAPANPAAGFDFQAGFNSAAPPGMPQPSADPNQGMGF